MRREYKKSELLYGVSYLLLFFFAFRFLNKNNTFLLLYASLGIYLAIIHRYLALSKECAVLLLYGLFYYCVRLYWGDPYDLTAFVTLAVGAPLMYMAGQQFVHYSTDKVREYKTICWIVAIGMFLFAILSYLKNGVIYNYKDGQDLRQIPDFWVGNASLWQATNINGYTVFAIILSMICFFQKKERKKILLAIVFLFGSIYLTLITAARTNLFLIVLIIISYFVLTLLLKQNFRFVSRKHTLSKVFLAILGLILAQIVILNLDNLLRYLPLGAFMERLNNRQLSISGDGRWEMWAKVLQEIPTHFWGNITSVYAAHNIYLDAAKESGMIPMILLLIFTIMVLATAWKLLWDKRYPIDLRILNGVLIYSLWASFLIEPVMTAKPFVFISFCMVCGMQKELSSSKAYRKNLFG